MAKPIFRRTKPLASDSGSFYPGLSNELKQRIVESVIERVRVVTDRQPESVFYTFEGGTVEPFDTCLPDDITAATGYLIEYLRP